MNPPTVQNKTSQLERWSWREGAGNNMTEEKGRFWVLRSQVRAPKGEKGKNPRCVCSEYLSETHEFHGTKTRNHPERMSKTEKTASNVTANEL